ncbi:MAG: hypothetical protein LCI00_19780 [Chloroflexi bacterium]|nr:hypothetical protein [Chloroflexota bacterium]MCC6891359.1 hypothetical protein [Anaerolineae bacterium]
MQTRRQVVGNQVYFVVSDFAPMLEDVLKGLYYAPFEEGFAKAFPANTPHLDPIYANFQRHMPDLILQAAGLQPARWEACLLALLERIEGQGLVWYLVGSGALAARGFAVQPHDIDLVVQEQGTSRMADLLLDCLVEPVSDSRGWIWDWFGRGFLHTRLEWVGEVNKQAEQDGPNDFGPTALARCEPIHWKGYTINVPPLDLQLAVSERRGLTARVEMIRAAMQGE